MKNSLITMTYFWAEEEFIENNKSEYKRRIN